MSLFGSSGIRALFSKDLLKTAYRVGIAVGEKYHNVIIGRDTRTSGDAMKHAVISGLLAAGAQCKDGGIMPTPTLAYVTREFDAGIMITASHNPPEYNGIKLFNPDGSSFDSIQRIQIEEKVLSESYDITGWEHTKRSDTYNGAIDNHIEGISPNFTSGLGIKVVVDAGCGAAAETTPRLLEKLGCEVITLNCYYSGFFPRGIEPVEANLKELSDLVKKSKADLGIAHDGDADRMMAVDDLGRFIAGDILLVILARAIDAKDIVTTLDASLLVEEMGVKVRRTKIGDTYVAEELRKGGDFGGETAGAWIFPTISLCPDGIYAAAQLASLARKYKISEVVDSIPVYPLYRGSMSNQGLNMKTLEEKLNNLKPLSMSNIDGIRLNFGDEWLLVRNSGTEPKIRVTTEAKTESRARELYDICFQAIKESINTGVKVN